MAVRDGVLIRSVKQQAATLQINTRNEHIRFRYMHMNPSAMDADGILNGRRVAEGEKIGVVSNYLDFPNGTSYHLHFDIQVFTRDGWIWVNPYTTLIASYERLIRSRGREIGTDPPISRRRGACAAGGCLASQRAARPRELVRLELDIEFGTFSEFSKASGIQNCNLALCLTGKLEKALLLDDGKSPRYGLQRKPKIVRDVTAIYWKGYDTRWCQATVHFNEKRCHAFQRGLASQQKQVIFGVPKVVCGHDQDAADDGGVSFRHALQAFAIHKPNGSVDDGFGCETMEIAIFEAEDVAW